MWNNPGNSIPILILLFTYQIVDQKPFAYYLLISCLKGLIIYDSPSLNIVIIKRFEQIITDSHAEVDCNNMGFVYIFVLDIVLVFISLYGVC